MVQPIVKWAGGKTQLLDKINQFLPQEFNRYYEPFIGGGAVFFNIAEKRVVSNGAVINDVNRALINMYIRVRDNTDDLIGILTNLDGQIPENEDDAKQYYYSLRGKYNQLLSDNTFDLNNAAYFIWLNKHCFNGLYRVNKKGLFNVPWNKSRSKSFNEENIRNASELLKNVDVRCGDFTQCVQECEEGDFIFFDSPYLPVKFDSFVNYTKDGFTQEDHIRLANTFKELDKKGIKLMQTNHNVEAVYELYGDFRIIPIDVRRSINADATNRTGKEVIITNYS